MRKKILFVLCLCMFAISCSSWVQYDDTYLYLQVVGGGVYNGANTVTTATATAIVVNNNYGIACTANITKLYYSVRFGGYGKIFELDEVVTLEYDDSVHVVEVSETLTIYNFRAEFVEPDDTVADYDRYSGVYDTQTYEVTRLYSTDSDGKELAADKMPAADSIPLGNYASIKVGDIITVKILDNYDDDKKISITVNDGTTGITADTLTLKE